MSIFSRSKKYSTNISILGLVANPLTLISSFGINLLALALPMVLLQVYDRIIPNKSFGTLTLLLIGLGSAIILEAALRYCRHLITAWDAARFEHNANMVGLKSVLLADNSEFQKINVAEHLERMVSIDKMRDFSTDESASFLADFPFIFLFMGLLLALHPLLMVVPLIVITIAMVSVYFVGKKLESSLDARSKIDDKRMSFLIETLTGIHSVKALGLEHLLERRYENHMTESAYISQKSSYYSHIAQSISSTFSQVTTVATACVGSLLVIEEMLSIGALAAAVLLSGRIVQPGLRALNYWSRMQTFKIAKRRYQDVVSISQEGTKGTASIKRYEKIVGEGISLVDKSEQRTILRNANFEFNAGEVVVLLGDSAIAKSSILALLRGAMRPNDGIISINNKPMSFYSLALLRRQTAYMPPRGRLLTGTIMDNICGFDVNRNIDQAISLTRLIGLDKSLASLPSGLDTEVSPFSENLLSTGAIQQISIIRALLGHTSLILFDEASSAVDQKTQSQLAQMLKHYRMLGATTVMVSEDTELLKLADRGYLVEDGNVIEINETQIKEYISGNNKTHSENEQNSDSNNIAVDVSESGSQQRRLAG